MATALRRRHTEIYLPLVNTSDSQQNKISKPYFPCYLFVNVDPALIPYSQLQWIPGLRCMISVAGCPVPVPAKFITLIKRKLGEIEAAGGLPTHSFNPGELVCITDGPFEGMSAIFDGPTTPSQRVYVLLTILGQVSKTQVPCANLKKAPSGTKIIAASPNRSRRTRGQGRRIKQHA